MDDVEDERWMIIGKAKDETRWYREQGRWMRGEIRRWMHD